MHKQRGVCQELSAVESWDDAIIFAEAKIRELKASIQGFRMAKERGDKWLGSQAVEPSQICRKNSSSEADRSASSLSSTSQSNVLGK